MERRTGRGTSRPTGRSRDREDESGTEPTDGYEDSVGRLRRLARLLPAALFALGLVLELATPPGVTVSAPFAATPLAAAALLSFRATVVAGVASSGTVALLTWLHDEVGPDIEPEARSITIATVSALAVGVNYVLRRSGEQLASARVVAEAVQLAVLPTPPTRAGGLVFATRYRAAQTDARIGGDFYAVEETPYGVRLLLGDVRGKGLGAVEAVVIVVGAFREAAEQEETLAGVAARLDRALQREGRRQLGTARFEGFTTAVLVEIPAHPPHPGPATPGGTAPQHAGSGPVLRLVNRGHPGPVLLHQGRTTLLEPDEPALPLGMTELGVWPDEIDEVPFPAGSQLLLYTDGLSEARNAHGVFYDPAGRLSRSYFADPEELLETVLIDVADHTGGEAVDDMALLAVAHETRQST
ncbi:PP2C family protein-serine/threonine phosphatase [Streptomyces reniochalinae]|uniref:Serine/threonine-protein phosphatase n=1 Tax=Streptomyces reniochalinae TaxID=2250578 RepID=A0A367E7A5_9ACTN|nr:PP2C family protein-serine/threonine phosphatase [Streptomyces reniochalinae]RCG13575.1 serine/threonine-protein phosphatase [Streptomyces reniochalinae]